MDSPGATPRRGCMRKEPMPGTPILQSPENSVLRASSHSRARIPISPEILPSQGSLPLLHPLHDLGRFENTCAEQKPIHKGQLLVPAYGFLGAGVREDGKQQCREQQSEQCAIVGGHHKRKHRKQECAEDKKPPGIGLRKPASTKTRTECQHGGAGNPYSQNSK